MHATHTNFWEWMPQMAGADFTVIITLAIFAVVGIVAIIGGTAYRIHKNRMDDSLKRELLDRGMTAEEIATVINAGQSRRRLK